MPNLSSPHNHDSSTCEELKNPKRIKIYRQHPTPLKSNNFPKLSYVHKYWIKINPRYQQPLYLSTTFLKNTIIII